jgi:hypothetical protein
MTLRRTLAILAATLIGSGLLAVGPVGPAVAETPQTAYFTMFAEPQVAPKRIFLTANSGPWLKRLAWEDWGTDEAVAHGVYMSDCASCLPPKRRTATVTFSRPVLCQGEGAGWSAYRRGVVHVSKPDQGHHKTTFRIPMGCP